MSKPNSWLRRNVRTLRKKVQYCAEYVLGGSSLRERALLALLGRHYESRFRRDWQLAAEPPHFFSHRIGLFRFAFGRQTPGPQSLYRGVFSSEVVRPGDHLLDIGCGDGFLTQRFLAPLCAHVDALDIEPTAIAAARRNHAAPQIKYHLCDAVTQPFPRDEYDVIVWDGALGHFAPETTARMFAKISSALAPDGAFVGSETLGDGEGDDHLQYFATLADLHAVLAPFFEHVQLRSVEYRLPSGFPRIEAFWRCAQTATRLDEAAWKTIGERVTA